MIKLDVEDYCQNCEDFKPTANTIKLYSKLQVQDIDTTVCCKYKDRCAGIARQIKEKEGGADVDRMP